MGNALSYTTSDHVLDLGPRGKVKGLKLDNKAYRYTGIPYGLPPTDQHRWRKPRPLPASFTYTAANGSPFDATSFQPPAYQQNRDIATGNIVVDDTQWTEDCLFVNIWTPVGGDKPWPVMVWLHGGWFQVGDACQKPESDVTELISTGGLDAIYVAVSYRLNVFGFLASQALLEESDAPGNFGLWDQRLALEWVYENIAAFGGDASNITLAGRSAGSYSVEAQVLHDFREDSAYAGNLFRRVFMCSNAITAQPKTLSEVEGQFDELCEAFSIPGEVDGKTKLGLLRKIPADELVGAIHNLKQHTFRPVTDDLFVHSGMGEYIANGQFAAEFTRRKMKLLIGEVANEDTLYTQFNGPQQPGKEALLLQLSNYYAPKTVDRVIQQYKLPDTDDLAAWKAVFGHIIADGQVRASLRHLVSSLYRHGVSVHDVWRYRIDYRLSMITEDVAPLSYGVSHAMDGPVWRYVCTV